MRQITIIIVHVLSFSQFVYATDYITPITGSKVFEDGDTITVRGEPYAINDSTTGSTGIHVNNNGAIHISLFKEGTMGQVTGVILANNTINDLGTGSTVQVGGDTYDYSIGIDIKGQGTTLTAADLSILNNNSYDYGLNITDNASVNLTGVSTVTSGMGIYVSDSASFTTDQITIKPLNLDSAIGVHVGTGATVNLGDGSSIVLLDAADYSQAIENMGGSVVAKNITITGPSIPAGLPSPTVYVDASGLINFDGFSITSQYVGVFTNNDSQLILKNGSVTVNTPDYGVGIDTIRSVATLDNVVLNVNAESGYGLSANNAQIAANNTTSNTNGSDVYAVYAVNHSIINLTGNTVINANDSNVALAALDSEINTGTVGSKMTINGSLFSQSNGLIDLKMLSGSCLLVS